MLTTQQRRTRRYTSLALFVYCAAVFLLVVHPTPLRWENYLCAVLAVIGAIGLIAFNLESVVIPGERYAYLVVGWAGFTTLLLYVIETNDLPFRRTAIILLLAVGVVGGYGAYLAEEYEGLNG